VEYKPKTLRLSSPRQGAIVRGEVLSPNSIALLSAESENVIIKSKNKKFKILIKKLKRCIVLLQNPYYNYNGN